MDIMLYKLCENSKQSLFKYVLTLSHSELEVQKKNISISASTVCKNEPLKLITVPQGNHLYLSEGKNSTYLH